MRHRKKRTLQVQKGAKKRSIVVRNLLTSLVLHGKVVTTPKRALVLKTEADKFFSSLMRRYRTAATEQDALRENIRQVKATIFGETAGKKVIQELIPQFKVAGNQSFVANYKIGFRPGDASMKTLVTLI